MGALLATLSLGVAAVFAVLAVRPRCGRPAAAAHALMGLGMADMFAPWADPVPPLLGAGVFAAVAAWFGGRWVRGAPAGPAGAAHLVLAPAAMAAMYLSRGHGGHHVGSVATAALWLAFAGYFGWHAGAGAGRLQRVRRAGTVIARPLWAEPGAHVVMSGLMAAMFLTAL